MEEQEPSNFGIEQSTAYTWEQNRNKKAEWDIKRVYLETNMGDVAFAVLWHETHNDLAPALYFLYLRTILYQFKQNYIM